MKKRAAFAVLLFVAGWVWGFLQGYGEGQLDPAGSINYPPRRR